MQIPWDFNNGKAKKQPQSATNMPNMTRGFVPDSKSKLAKASDAQEAKIFEIVNQWEQYSDANSKMEFLKGKLSSMLITQTGSRFIQKQLTEDTPGALQSDESVNQAKNDVYRFTTFVLEEIGEKVNELMIDT